MHALSKEISSLDDYSIYGRVSAIRGLKIEITGPMNAFNIGSHLMVEHQTGKSIPVEIIGFDRSHAIAMPFKNIDGIAMGAKARLSKSLSAIHPSNQWLGRVINGLAAPLDGKGILPSGMQDYAFRRSPPPAHQRATLGGPINLGVRALNSFVTCCKGQRLGIFSGSGVGKSVLLSMLARNADCDVFVIGLIGERGREVQEFIYENLGEEGMNRACLIVATSDEAPLMRRQAALTTMAVAEYFRDQGKNVFCMIDSLTRFAMAQREIGLSCGEPPATKGFTPTVFSELPALLERAGPGTGEGAITGLFTVLVEGDDMNEPVSDAVRGILDGHIVLDRSIAERGRYPAVNVLKSVSRTMPDCAPEHMRPLLRQARQYLAQYDDMEEIIRMGVYRPGSNPEVDDAIHYTKMLEDYFHQEKHEVCSLSKGYEQLAHILNSSTHDVNDEEIVNENETGLTNSLVAETRG